MISFDCRQLPADCGAHLLQQLSVCSKFILVRAEAWLSNQAAYAQLDPWRLWLDLDGFDSSALSADVIAEWLNSGIGALVLPVSMMKINSSPNNQLCIPIFDGDNAIKVPRDRVFLRVSLTAFSAYLTAAPTELANDPLALAITGNRIGGLLIDSCADCHQLAGMHQLMAFNRQVLPTSMTMNVLIASDEAATVCVNNEMMDTVRRFLKDFDQQISNFVLCCPPDSVAADASAITDWAADWLHGLMQSDRPDGLLPTIVVNRQQQALGLVYSTRESMRAALRSGRGVYYSRSRQELWEKGKTSGAWQRLHRVDCDCDRDCLRFEVTQVDPGFCHFQTASCFGGLHGLQSTVSTLQSRLANPIDGSYTARLFANPDMLHAKLREEAQELCDAQTAEDVAWETADLLYFAMVKCIQKGVSLADIERQLDRRSLRITRRPGLVKPQFASCLATASENEGDEKLSAADNFAARRNGNSDAELSFNMRVYNECDFQKDPRLAARLLQRPIMDTATVMSRVQPIIENVRSRGDAAVIEYTAQFDRVQLQTSSVLLAPFPEEQLAAVSAETRKAIDLAYGNIERFHRAQLHSEPLLQVETTAGVFCSRFHRPIDRVGLYVPGGSAVLPSTAMMLGVPAKVAGCPHITLATPPRADGTVCPEVLYIAQKIGAERILVAGGAQAIAALAYGTEQCPKVDKICGPGNQYVTAAKMLVQNDPRCLVAIDMPAGPSEVLVIADVSQADPAFVAADLLSQAEHGPDSQAVLLTVGNGPLTEQFIANVQRELNDQALKLPRRQIVAKSLWKSFILTHETLDQAMHFSNEYAPEHLILHINNPESILSSVRNAGSVFLGPYSPESCGDYASGTNHTLPTYGYAKMFSGVNTQTFMKSITAQQLTEKGLCSIGPAVAHLASIEGLDAHRNAVLLRLEKLSTK